MCRDPSRSAGGEDIYLYQCASTALACGLVPLSAEVRKGDAMKENPENDARVKQRSPTWRTLATASAILAVVQACLTIEGMGIEGFILWVVILFVGYWLFFTLLAWLWRRFGNRL